MAPRFSGKRIGQWALAGVFALMSTGAVSAQTDEVQKGLELKLEKIRQLLIVEQEKAKLFEIITKEQVSGRSSLVFPADFANRRTSVFSFSPSLEQLEGGSTKRRVNSEDLELARIEILLKSENIKDSRLPLITFDAATPVHWLVPAAPQNLLRPRHLLPRSLDEVAEIALHNYLDKNKEKSLDSIRNTIGKILHLNNKKTDRFMEELIALRPDMQGLPFVLGGACRKHPAFMKDFSVILDEVRATKFTKTSKPIRKLPSEGTDVDDLSRSEDFWPVVAARMTALERDTARADHDARATMRRAQIAALMQVCGPENAEMKSGMARHLSGVAHADSSRALAKLAVFSPEEDVRRDAVEALKVRRDEDYSDMLQSALRYPWPQVARSAAEAIVALERRDLIPTLVAVLGEADPRLPRVTDAAGKKVRIVREMVKLNHHRNCFLCHPPVNPDSPPSDVLSGAVPNPGEPLPSFSDGYRNSTPNLAVRIDATYLRQDFSIMFKVEGADPWPEMQRFDFLVRSRVIDDDEAREYIRAIEPTTDGALNPYHRAAVWALRELTGRDAAPTADAWRSLLSEKR